MARALLQVNDGRRRVFNTDSVYYLEAVGGDTLLRRRGARPLRDIRNLGAILTVESKRKTVGANTLASLTRSSTMTVDGKEL